MDEARIKSLLSLKNRYTEGKIRSFYIPENKWHVFEDQDVRLCPTCAKQFIDGEIKITISDYVSDATIDHCNSCKKINRQSYENYLRSCD